MNRFRRFVLVGLLLGFATTPVHSQRSRPHLDLVLGTTRAVGGEWQGRTGVRVEAGAATSPLWPGLRVGVQISLDLRPQSGLDNCLYVPASSLGACAPKAPTLMVIAPELRWNPWGDLGIRVGGGPAWAGEERGWGLGLHFGADLTRPISSRSAALISVRAHTVSGGSDGRVSTVGFGLGLQRWVGG